jgi:hypothetical protein
MRRVTPFASHREKTVAQSPLKILGTNTFKVKVCAFFLILSLMQEAFQ